MSTLWRPVLPSPFLSIMSRTYKKLVRVLKHQTKRLLDRSVAAFAKSSQCISNLPCSFTLTLD